MNRIRTIIGIIGILTMAGLMTTYAGAEYVTAPEGLRVRSEPNTESKILRVLSFAEEVSGTVKDGWMKIEEGYVKAEYLSEENPMDDFEYAGSWLTTAYTHTGYACANGQYPQAGYTIATNSLSMGTEVYISGIGFRTVCDRGPGSMPDAWLDIFMDGYGECVQYGAQYRDVFIVKHK